MLMKNSRKVFGVYSVICSIPIQSLSLKKGSVVDIYHSRPGDWCSSPRVLGIGVLSSSEEDASLHLRFVESSFSWLFVGFVDWIVVSCMM